MPLFAASFLVLFLELALIRWIPAHALYLTFFTNAVLLASFLGLVLGCLRARSKDWSGWTPVVLALTMAAAHAVERLRPVLEPHLDAGGQSAPQMIFFGTEFFRADLGAFPIPIEVLAGLFFVLVAACLFGPGQRMGRLLEERGGGTSAYALNLLGSLAGVLAFAAVSFLELTPLWWFAAVAALLESSLWKAKSSGPPPAVRAVAWTLVLAAAAWTSGGFSVTVPRPGGAPLEIAGRRQWSPYYRIDWFPAPYGDIRTNLLSHQRMTPLSEPDATYALPHLLRRDSGGKPFDDALVIGAGSGNDLARALQWGAKSVDAVEIDPAIQRIGRDQHPDRPYADPRVTAIVDDGRNALRRGGKKYDLIVYALVDSLVLHSGYSNIRLESYLFTREAIASARDRLKPGGTLILYNYYRTGWVAARLHETLREAFGAPPLVVTVPYQPVVDENSSGGFTLLIAGDTEGLGRAFARSGVYRMGKVGFGGKPPRPGETVDGVALSEVRVPAGLAPATDDWPFLYLRSRMIPAVTARGALIMAGLSALLLWLAAGRGGSLRAASPRMFFLGAGFMLLETRAVVTAALFLGGTWVVNSFVFAGVLAGMLAANLLAARLKPRNLAPWYAGLFISLAASWLIPPVSLAAAAAPPFAALFFAGVVFSASFARSKRPAADFGANIAGAMAGGLAENASMLFGFRGLAALAAAFYFFSLRDTE